MTFVTQGVSADLIGSMKFITRNKNEVRNPTWLPIESDSPPKETEESRTSRKCSRYFTRPFHEFKQNFSLRNDIAQAHRGMDHNSNIFSDHNPITIRNPQFRQFEITIQKCDSLTLEQLWMLWFESMHSFFYKAAHNPSPPPPKKA